MKCNSDKTLIKEFHQRALSFINCILLTSGILLIHGKSMINAFSAGFDVSQKSSLENMFNKPFDESSNWLLIQLFGYMVLDTFWCWFNDYNSLLNFLHHFITIGYCWSMLTVNDTSLEAMIGLFLSEFSNLFLNWYWFACFFKWKLETFSGLAFSASFFLSRVIGATWLVFWLFQIQGRLPMRIVAVTMCCVNAGFLFYIVKNLVNHFTGKGAKLE